MFCVRCGRAIPEGAGTCAYCAPSAAAIPGSPADLQKGAEALRATARTFLFLGILNIIVGIVLTACGWIPGLVSIVIGIFELIKAGTFGSTPPKSLSRPVWLSIMEMINVLTGASLWGLIGGIANYRRLTSPEVMAYIGALEAGVTVPVAPGTAAPPALHPLRPTRHCPACAEEILLEASLCRFCGRVVPPEEISQARKEYELQAQAAAQATQQAVIAGRQRQELRRTRGRVTRRWVFGIILGVFGGLVLISMIAMFFASPSPGNSAAQQKNAAVICGIVLGLTPLGLGIGLIAWARSLERAQRTTVAQTDAQYRVAAASSNNP